MIDCRLYVLNSLVMRPGRMRTWIAGAIVLVYRGRLKDALKAIPRDVISSAPSMCIFQTIFSFLCINQNNIENRQYLVNMKLVHAVVMSQ